MLSPTKRTIGESNGYLALNWKLKLNFSPSYKVSGGPSTSMIQLKYKINCIVSLNAKKVHFGEVKKNQTIYIIHSSCILIFDKLLPYLIYLSKWRTPNGTFEKSSKMEKMKKFLVNLPSTNLSEWFRVPDSITIMHHVHIYLVMIYFDFYLYNFVITLFALCIRYQRNIQKE